MRTHFHDTVLLLLFIVAASAVHAQSSPSPVIQDYDNTSLPAPLQVGDTTFCHTQWITIHGQDFKKATGGEIWDTTWVVFGIVAPTTVNIVTQGNGNNDRITCQIPLSANIPGNDTCMLLRLIKKTHLGMNNYFYYGSDTICLTGDRANVAYGDSTFCLGDTNPRPAITLKPLSATGMFCCRTGAPGFWVNPATGEMPLHPGAVGNNNQFLYCTNHPRCADTVAFTVAIQPRQPAVATINGMTVATVCQGGGTVMPDSTNLYPSSGVFRSPTGLYLLNPLTGQFDPALSPTGLHELWFVPQMGCYDSTMIQVIVLPTSTATVGYPSIPLNLGVPTLCQGNPAVWPTFTTGNAGGTFLATPVGLDLGPTGDINPANSLAGIYTVQYATTGQCPDTVTAIANLHIDTTLSAQFTLPQTQYCANGILAPQALTASGTWQVTSPTGQVLYSQGTATIAVAATGIPSGANYQLQHVTGGFCSDTASVPFSVLPTDNPAFTYPPNGNFCIGDPDPWPLVSGTGGGYFVAVTPSTVVDIDGRLHLTASGAGTHTVRHVTGGSCKDSTDVTVQIFGSASANFAYPASVFCSGDTNPLPQILGTPGGTFTSDTGLIVDSVSGAILLAQSQAGTFNVTYTLTGSCQAQFTQTVQVSPTDSSTIIAYIPNHYCQSEPDAMPLILGDTVGSFVAGGGIVFSNTDLGLLDLSAMQPGGPYIVYYDIDNRCAIDTRDSVWIDTPDDPTFSYPQSSYCEGGANPLPDLIAMPGGTFAEVTGSVVFADSTTGEIDASQSLQGGPYFISYTSAGPCPESYTRQLAILPKPIGANLAVAPDTAYCTGQSLILQATAGGATAWRWYLNGAPLAATDDLLILDTQLTGLDQVGVAMENSQGCSDSLAVNLTGLPAPRLTALVTGAETNILGASNVTLQVSTDIGGTMVDWVALGTNLHELTPSGGSIVAFGPSTPASVAITATANSPHDLGWLTVVLSPRNASCDGFKDTVRITLGPDTLPIFVPEVFTPDGNGQNDTWMITCLDGTDPAGYKMHLFNSAGGQVLEMDGLHQHFDGGTLPDGVYWWVLQDMQGRDLQWGGLTIRRK